MDSLPLPDAQTLLPTDSLAPLDAESVLVKSFNPNAKAMNLDEMWALWTALEGILVDALDYDRRSLSESEQRVFDFNSLALKQLDDAICAALYAEGKHAKYVDIDEQLQQNLLFSNIYLNASSREVSAAISSLLRKQRQALGNTPGLPALFDTKLALLDALGCLVPGSKKGADHACEAVAWVRYYAWRKLSYLRNLRAAYHLHDYAFDYARVYKQLLHGSDLLLAFPAALLADPVVRGQGLATPASTPASAEAAGQVRSNAPLVASPPPPATPGETMQLLEELAGYLPASRETLQAPVPTMDFAVEYQKNKEALREVSNRLDAAGDALSARQTAAERDAYVTAHTRLVQERDACTSLLERRNTEGLFLAKVKTQAAAGGAATSKSDGAAAGKAALQALCSGAGAEISAAVLAGLKGEKVNGQALFERVARTLIVAGGTAAATYFLGPMGTMVAGALLSGLLAKPGPLGPSLLEIQKDLKDGFTKVDTRLDTLDQRIRQGFEGMKDNFDDLKENQITVGNYVADKVRLNGILQQFRNTIAETDKLMDEVETNYRGLYVRAGGMSVPPNEQRLVELNEQVRTSLEGVVKELYHRSYSLFNDTLGNPEAGASPTVAETLISFYQQPGLQFRPFHMVCRELLVLCERVKLLTDRYFSTRRHLQQALAAVAVFHDTTSLMPNKQTLLRELVTMSASGDKVQANVLAGTYGLASRLIGPTNLGLYHELMTYWHEPQQFSMQRGFGLLALPTTAPGTAHALPDEQLPELRHVVEAGQAPQDAWFSSQPRNGPPARYYVAPPTHEFGPGHYTYCLYTAQQLGLPRPLTLYLALAEDDQLLLYSPHTKCTNNTEPTHTTRAKAVLLNQPLFAGSLEQWLLAGQPLAVRALMDAPLFLGLPQADHFLRLSIDRRYHGTHVLEAQVWQRRAGEQEMTVRTIGLRSCGVVESDQLLPTLRPTGMGLLKAPNPAGYDEPNWFANLVGEAHNYAGWAEGFWTTNDALGIFKSPAEQPQPGPVPGGQGLFPFVCYENQPLQQMRSADGRWQLRFVRPDGYESLLLLFYKGDNLDVDYLRGSMFDTYDYRDQRYEVRAALREDGRLVLADATGHEVAALGKPKAGHCFLYLNNKGELWQRQLSTGKAVHWVEAAPVRLQRRDWSSKMPLNRMFAGWHMKQHLQQKLTSANGQYTLEMKWLDQDKGNGKREYGVRLELLQGKECKNWKEYKHLLPEQVQRPEWEPCNAARVEYLDHEMTTADQKLVWLENRPDGTIACMLGTHSGTWLGYTMRKFQNLVSGVQAMHDKQLGLNEDKWPHYGLKELQVLYRGNGLEVVLELTDDGQLVVRPSGGGVVLATLLGG